MDNNPNPSPAPSNEPLSSTSPVNANPETSTQPSQLTPPAAPTNDPVPSPPLPGAVVMGGDGPAQPAQPVVGGSFSPQPQPGDSFGSSAQQPPAAPPQPGSGSKRRLPKVAFLTLLALTLLGFASAAAYFGVVVPNQPQNQLKTALINTVKEKRESFKGTISADASDEGFSMKMDVNGKTDSAKKAADFNTLISISGVQLNVEARFVDNNIYLKTSDLNTIAALAGQYSPEASNLIKSVSNTISNKWIEVDSTLLKEAGAGCVLGSNWTITDKDVDLLVNQYEKHQFATIKDTSSDSVNGTAATKFNLKIDNKKADQYANSLDGLSMIKSLKECSASKDLSDDATGASSGTTNLTIWVDKATKHVKQIGYNSTEDGAKIDVKVSFDYKPVSIEKPAKATPVMDIFAQLQSDLGNSGIDFTSLFSGLGGSGPR